MWEYVKNRPERRPHLNYALIRYLIVLFMLSIGLPRSSAMFGEDATAKLGDPAAPISVSEWIQGGPVQIEKGNIYVLDFWTCSDRRNISERIESYPSIVFAGIALGEPEKIRTIVEKENMKHPVSIDNNWKTIGAYKAAYDADVFPCLFVVDAESHVVWHGKPDDEDLPVVLTSLQDGTLDLEATAQKIRERQQRGKASYELFKATIKLDKTLTPLLETEPFDFPAIESHLRKPIAEIQSLASSFASAEELQYINDLFMSAPYLKLGFGPMGQDKQCSKRALTQLLTESTFTPVALVQTRLSARIDERSSLYDPVFGLVLAQYAVDNLSTNASDTEKSRALSDYAKALHLNNRNDDAVAAQEKAVELNPSDQALQDALQSYREALKTDPEAPVPAE